MESKHIISSVILGGAILLLLSCAPQRGAVQGRLGPLPERFPNGSDSISIADRSWRTYFAEEGLVALIDSALANNQELHVVAQEIGIARNEVQARKGEYLPFVHLRGGAGLEKEGRYTRHGVVDEQLDIEPGKHFPDPLTDLMLGAYATWELDIWKKLRNAKKSATMSYLASIEGRQFLVTQLIAEIASEYYELIALDNLQDIVQQNIELQTSALNVVRLQKDAARVTQLAVNRFEAQLYNTRSLEFEIRQRIVERENRIRFLVGGFSGPIARSSAAFFTFSPFDTQVGMPSQLLRNRPDIRRAELALEAARLDVEVARANFFPSVGISAGVGLQAFNPVYLIQPQSLLYNLAGDLVAPLVNRNAIIAEYRSASNRQLQAVFQYEQTVLAAYLDVWNQMARLENFGQGLELKSREVEILQQSVSVANSLFNSARADYAEVLLTQREALEARFDLVEIRLKQLQAQVNIYRALGGGWQ